MACRRQYDESRRLRALDARKRVLGDLILYPAVAPPEQVLAVPLLLDIKIRDGKAELVHAPWREAAECCSVEVPPTPPESPENERGRIPTLGSGLFQHLESPPGKQER